MTPRVPPSAIAGRDISDAYTTGDFRVLSCPCCCGGDYLHQGRVEIFHRCHEDAPSRSITIDGGELPRLGAAGRNPSSRRGGLLIYFSCEFCGVLPVALAIAQHKGTTLIDWVQP